MRRSAVAAMARRSHRAAATASPRNGLPIRRRAGRLRGVRSYGQYCPVARTSEILGMRWTPIIVRNLLLGCETFGELREGAPGIPRTLLSDRLRLLEHHG